MKKSSSSGSRPNLVHYFAPFLILLTSCGSIPSPSGGPEQTLPSGISQKFLIEGSWYDEFEKKFHRPPVLEFIKTPLPEPTTYPYVYASPQLTIVNTFPTHFRGAALASGKVSVVSYRIRQFASLERFFQMKHASSDSVAQPGHVTGADFVVVFSPSASGPDAHSNWAVGRILLDSFTLFIPEIIFYPALGPWKTYTATVSFGVQLIDLRNDQEVAEEQILFDGDSNRRWSGKWHAMVSSSSGHMAKFHLNSSGWEIVEEH